MATFTQSNKNLQWDLLIEGKSVFDSGLSEYIESITFSVEKNLMTIMEITLYNPIVSNNSSTKNIFARGRMLSFYCGWGKKEYIGSCLSENAKLDVSGERITFTAFDKGKELAREEKDEVWKNMTDSQIATIIAMKYGLVPKITPTTAKVSRVQHNITDYRFLNHLAYLNHYAFYVCFNPLANCWELHFEKPKEFNESTGSNEIYRYDYIGDKSLILSFIPEVSGSIRRDTTITLNAYLLDEKKESKLSKEAKSGKLITLTGSVAGRSSNEIIERRFQNEEEAKAYLDKLIKDREEAYMTASSVVVGNTDLKCLDFVYFGGFKFKFFDDLDGYWRMDRVKHRLIPESCVFTSQLDLVRIQKEVSPMVAFISSDDTSDLDIG